MIIDTEKIEKALFSGTAPSVAERFTLSLATVNQYRASKDAKAFRDWKKISLEKAEKIMEIINNEEENNMFAFNPFNQFYSLDELEESKGLKPVAEKDAAAIEKALGEDLGVMIDDLNRVWTEGGTYIADVEEV